MSAARPVLIAGGGIGGLALSLALAQRGRECHVIERRERFSEAGAGIQLGPNAVRILQQLGVADTLATRVGSPEHIAVTDGRSGRNIQRLPLGNWIANRHGAPYWVAHRADVQAALLEQVTASPGIRVTTAFEVVAMESAGDGVTVLDTQGRRLTGAILVGADGIWSKVRELVDGGTRPHPVGKLAMRCLIPTQACDGLMKEPVVGVWLSPGTHVVHYPVRAGSEVAVVVIADDPAPAEGWGREVKCEEVLPNLVDFSPTLTRSVVRAPDWRAWSLYDGQALARWSNGSVTLLGDAAHPLLPFLAQGGAMALEDAVVLASCIAAEPDNPHKAFNAYERMRVARVRRLQSAARRNGRIYHARGIIASARNLTMSLTGGAAIMSGYDWIYSWCHDDG